MVDNIKVTIINLLLNEVCYRSDAFGPGNTQTVDCLIIIIIIVIGPSGQYMNSVALYKLHLATVISQRCELSKSIIIFLVIGIFCRIHAIFFHMEYINKYK